MNRYISYLDWYITVGIDIVASHFDRHCIRSTVQKWSDVHSCHLTAICKICTHKDTESVISNFARHCHRGRKNRGKEFEWRGMSPIMMPTAEYGLSVQIEYNTRTRDA